MKHSSVSSGDTPYLPNTAFEKVALLHASSGQRHFWGLFLDSQKDITFYIVNPVVNKQQNQVKAVNMKSIYNQSVTESLTAQGTDQEEQLAEYLSWEVSNTVYFTELGPALKAIDQKLQEYKGKFKGASIAVL